MLQRKCDQFRIRIRKDDIQKFKLKKRKQIFHYKSINLEDFHLIQNLFIKLQEIINNNRELAQENKLNSVKECFDKLTNTSKDNEFKKIITYSINNQKLGSKIIELFKDCIVNELKVQKQTNQEIEEDILMKYPTHIRQFTLLELFKVVKQIQFYAIDEQVFKKIVDCLFSFLGETSLLFKKFVSHTDISLSIEYSFLHYVLSIFNQIFEEIRPQAYRYLSYKGLGLQIIKIVNKLMSIKVQIKIYWKIFLLISKYLDYEIKLTSQPSKKDDIGGVTITTQNVSEKEHLLMFCISFIDKQQQDFYPIIFESMKNIFELQNFLASEIKEKYLFKITSLILHETRNIQNQSLLLLNDLIFHSESNTNILLEKGQLLDLIYKRLQIQKISTDDKQIQKNVETIAYMICNIMLTDRKQLRQLVEKHYIWEQIYSNFHYSSRLFPLIMTMPYFFNNLGHKNFLKYYTPFLQALNSFEWQICAYNEQIKDTLERVFQKASNDWQQHEYEKYLKVMEQNGFLHFIQDRVGEEYLNELRGIEM